MTRSDERPDEWTLPGSPSSGPEREGVEPKGPPPPPVPGSDPVSDPTMPTPPPVPGSSGSRAEPTMPTPPPPLDGGGSGFRGGGARFRSGAHVAETEEPLRLRPPAERFVSGSELGRGGMGRVIEWFDRDLDRPVAAKLIREGADRTAVRRFLNEARITARLEHPNIVPVHDIGFTDQGKPYYTMKRIDGTSVSAIVRGIRERDPETLEEHPIASRVDIVRSACQAVAYAHDRGIVHQDLKPGNVMVGAFGEVLVLDWGLAIDLEKADSSSVGGTLRYMAPEQIEGEVPGPASDVYALGGILYALLTGSPPFPGQQGAALTKAVLFDRPEPPSVRSPEKGISSALDAICLKALEKEPADRYPDAEALLDDINRYRAGLAVRARPEPLWRKVVRWMGRHRGVTSGILSAILAGLLVTGVLAYQRRQEAIAARKKQKLAERKRRQEIDAEIEKLVTDARQVNRTISHERAIRRLQLLRHPHAVEVLLPLLDDENEWVRLLATEGLGWVGYQLAYNEPEMANQVAEALLDRLEDPSRSVRRAAILFLARLAPTKKAIARALERYVLEHEADTVVMETNDEWAPYLARRLGNEEFGDNSTATVADLMTRALRVARTNDLERALALYDEVLARDPEHGRAHLGRGRLLLQLDRVEEAEEALEEALRVTPRVRQGEIHGALGNLYLERGEYQRALKAYRKASETGAEPGEVAAAIGTLYMRTGKLRKALEAYRRAEETKFGDSARVHREKATVLMQLGRYEEAMASVNEAIRLNDRAAEAYRTRGWIHFFLGNREAAILDQEQAIKLRPDFVSGYEQRGGFFFNLYARDRQSGNQTRARDSLNRAIEDWKTCLEMDETRSHAHGNLAAAYGERARFLREEGQWKQAMAVLEKAVDHADKALALGPGTSTSFGSHGFENPSADPEGVRERFRNEQRRKKAMAYRQMAQIHLQDRDGEGAIEAWTKAIDLGLGTWQVYTNRGFMRYQLGQRGEGVRNDLEKALQLNPSHPQRGNIEKILRSLD